MEFARPGAADFSATDKEVMDETVSFVTNRCYKQNIDVITQLEDNLLRIYADPQQIEQVLMNLYLNSIDAMPDGGRLTIEAKDAPDFPAFFTSQKKSGLGLGLPIGDRIIQNHGGRIGVASAVGQGSSFRIYLPLGRSE